MNFNQIPTQIGVPGAYVEFDGSGARGTPTAKPVRLLVFGQMAAALVAVTNPLGSTALADVPVQVQNNAQAIALFGKHSIITNMLRVVFKTNSLNEVWAVPQSDAVGTAAAWEVTYTANYPTPSLNAGVETLYIGGVQFRAAVSVGTTAAAVATAMAAAINADTSVPYTAAAAAGVLTITGRHTGESLNDLQIHQAYYSSDVSPSGASPTIVQTAVGAGNPSNAAAIAATAAGYYTDIIQQYSDAANMTRLEAELDARWAPLPDASSTGPGQNDAHAYIAFRGSEAQLNVYQAAGRNNQHVTCLAVEPSRTVSGRNYPGLLSPVWEVAASYGALVAKESGIAPNANLQNVNLPCLIAAPEVSKWTWNERNRFILSYGFATYKYDDSSNVVLERATTMHLTTTSGAATDAERDTETQKLNSYLRWSLRTTVLAKYQRYRLAEDGPGVGRQQNVVTPLRLKASILALADFWVDQGYIENLKGFKESLIVERSSTDCNTMNARLQPDHVNQFRVFAAQIGYIVCG